ncbi:MAG: hypothetical protein J6Q67_04440 [Clostridia bacterium]|nr:hypothetical protein [Clostridia bacterium]
MAAVTFLTNEDKEELQEEMKDIQSGADGKDGKDGLSAYEIALKHGFEGSEEEWLLSLQGKDGADGKDGAAGADGYTPQKGVDYFTYNDKLEVANEVLKLIPQGDEVSY